MPKEQDPAMLFYGKDFFDDIHVCAMNYAQQGMYIRLLWWCWSEGGIPANPEHLRVLLKRTPEEWAEDWPLLSVCFFGPMMDPNGATEILISRKVEKIREARHAYRKAASDRGRAAAEKRWKRTE